MKRIMAGNRTVLLVSAYLVSVQLVGCAESYREVNLAELAGFKGADPVITQLKFANGVFCVRDMRMTNAPDAALSFDDLEIDPSDGQILSIKTGPAIPLRTHELTPADRAAVTQAEIESRNLYHPTVFGKSALKADVDGTLYLEKDGEARRQINSHHCFSLRAVPPPGLGFNTFFLDEQHIYMADCGKHEVISPSGKRLYTIRPLFPIGPVVRAATVVAALNPSSTVLDALFLSPESSTTLYVFCLSNGKTLLTAHWTAANRYGLDVSSDGAFVALASRSAVRFYRIDPLRCSR